MTVSLGANGRTSASKSQWRYNGVTFYYRVSEIKLTPACSMRSSKLITTCACAAPKGRGQVPWQSLVNSPLPAPEEGVKVFRHSHQPSQTSINNWGPSWIFFLTSAQHEQRSLPLGYMSTKWLWPPVQKRNDFGLSPLFKVNLKNLILF